jgi:hypothetical protein
MRRFAAIFILFALALSTTAAPAAEGRVCKVLPQYLDQKGRASIAPSLYERDAYQTYLRKHPQMLSALHMVIQYRAKGLDWEKARLRVEVRGLLGDTMQTTTLEKPVKKSGFFGNWANFDIAGDEFKKFGALVAWRVSLWEGDRQLSERQSFLWTGVPMAAR